jgi:dynein heavy chain
LTNEPPKGLKANLKRTFNEVTEEDYDSCSRPREYKKLLFALGYFHAVILERRKYGAIGWNIPYEWMNSDFVTSKTQLKMYLDEQPETPYIALNYLVAEVNYGGRVTDDKDIRLIKALLKKYFCAEIMNDNYRLSKLDTYYAPHEGTLNEAKGYINLLPLEDDPEVFGLHSNANIAFEQKTVREFVETILMIQPRISGGKVTKTDEEIVSDMAKEILSRLPKLLDKKKAHEQTFQITESGQMVSVGVFAG